MIKTQDNDKTYIKSAYSIEILDIETNFQNNLEQVSFNKSFK